MCGGWGYSWVMSTQAIVSGDGYAEFTGVVVWDVWAKTGRPRQGL